MREQKLSDDACKNIIRTIALRHKIEPRLITTQLMSEDDKDDMRRGELPIVVLDLYIQVWIKAGCPDYAHGNTEPLIQIESKDNDRQPEKSKESRRDVKKERIVTPVTPAPLVPPKTHGQWEYRKPFIQPEDNLIPVSEEGSCLSPQTSSSESYPKEE